MRVHSRRDGFGHGRGLLVAVIAALVVGGGTTASWAAPGLGMTMTADRASVDAGDTIGFGLTITNAGASTTRNVTVSDALPTDAGTTWSIDSQSGSACSISNSSMACHLAAMPSGTAYSVHVVSPTTPETARSTPVENVASATSSKGGSATATASVEVTARPRVGTRTAGRATVTTANPRYEPNNPSCTPWFTSCWHWPVPVKYTVTFAATVLAEDGQVVGEGTVTFSASGLGCTGAVRDGVATCDSTGVSSPDPAVAAGTGSTSAAYSGSAAFAPSSSTL